MINSNDLEMYLNDDAIGVTVNANQWVCAGGQGLARSTPIYKCLPWTGCLCLCIVCYQTIRHEGKFTWRRYYYLNL